MTIFLGVVDSNLIFLKVEFLGSYLIFKPLQIVNIGLDLIEA